MKMNDSIGIRNGSWENRCKSLEDLVASNHHYRNEQQRDKFYSHVFCNTVDLLDKSVPSDIRHRVWRVYIQLLDGQAETIGQMRYYLFDVIHVYESRDEDIPCLIDFLMALTDHGKTLTHYESKIECFIIHWIETLFERTTSFGCLQVKKYDSLVQQKFLKFLINLIKYNAACVASDNQKALIKMLRYVCALAYESESITEMKLIYEFMNVVLSYSHLPNETLSQFVVILCIGVNRDELYHTCNKIMRNLIGTYLGFACLTTLHHIIEDEINFNDKLLIRGAVYYLVQSLWGDMVNEESSISANVVLAAFKNLLNNDVVASPHIDLEIANGIYIFISSVIQDQNKPSNRSIISHHMPIDPKQKEEFNLSMKSSEIVYQYTWDLVLDVCDILVSNHFIPSKNGESESSQLNTMIISILKLLEKLICQEFETDVSINSTDLLLQNHEINSLMFLFEQGFIEKIFSIFEIARDHLTKETLCNLIEHRLNHINKYRYDLEQKLKQLKHAITIYFISSPNNAIRLKCLEKLANFLNECTFLDVDTFWEKVASSFFLSSDNNPTRELAINFLIFLAKKSRSNKNLIEFIEIFDTMFHNRFKMYQRQHSLETIHHRSQHGGQILHQISAPNTCEVSMFDDAIQSINGLITIFCENINKIHCHSAAIQAFRSLVKVLSFIQKLHHHSSEDSNCSSAYTRTLSLIKRKLFHTVLSLRTNRWAQLGIVDNSNQSSSETLGSSPHQFGRTCEITSEESVRFTPYILVRDVTCVVGGTTSVTTTTHNHNTSHNSPPISPQHQGNLQHRQQQQTTGTAGTNSSHLNTSSSFHAAFIEALKSVIESIQYEKDWSVLHLIFVELPKTLKHKGLILAATSYSSSSSAHSTPSSSMTHLSNKTESIPDLIVNALCNFIDSIQSRFHELHFGEMKVNKVDILAHIYNSISALVGYKLLSSSQTSIVKCLQHGLIHFSSKISCVRQCIVSLTICSIEMQTTMNKYLQDIIIQLSKITTNKALAVPKLEFLSNIILFPDIYYTFTNKQYLSILMIAQSYIIPDKYGEYTVALALRVISMWFLKCPIACRMNLVHFLMKGFQNNILKEVEPNLAQLSHRLSNADASVRQFNRPENRFLLATSPPPPPSTPLTQNVFTFQSFSSSSHQPSGSDHHSQQQQQQQQFSLSSSSAFNTVGYQQLGASSVILDPNDKENSKIELVEVCMDMLASNAFTTSSPLPLKPSMIDKLLNKEKTQFWMIGHKIIQITTTGCTSRAMRNGLCNKCYTICHMNKPQPTIQQKKPSNHQYPHQSQPHHSLTSLANQWNEKFIGSNGQFSSVEFTNSTSNYSQSHLIQSSGYHSNQANQANRRRHRSEINHSTKMKNSNFTNDDYFMNQQHQIPGSSSTESDLNAVSRYCRCWCQTWAEILIRRATGTTRIILRVENNLGDFPNWTSSKEEDDSLAQIFENSNPDLNLALKLQRNSGSIQNMVDEISLEAGSSISSDEVKSSDSGTISYLVDQQLKAKTSQPVARAASFGSRPLQAHNNTTNSTINTDARDISSSIHEMARSHIVRKLEKDFSFEENTPEGSQTSLVSSSYGDNIDHQQQQTNVMFRDRGHTISVMTPVQKSSSSTSVGSGHSQTQIQESSMSASNMSLSTRQSISPVGLSPQFVFLQLYYNSMFREETSIGIGSNEKPIQLERNEALNRSLNIFDRITPYETHKIGVLYVGPGQVNSRSEILANQIGSYRYARFLKDIGQLISLEDVDPRVFYVGGLGIKDSPYAISWCDHLVQMIFHVATMMPTLPNDPNCNNKMAHIGNDLVCIIYNNSGEKVDLSALRGGFGQVLQAMVMITPLEYESNIVEIQSKKEFAEFIGHTESQVLSDAALPVYVRQLALHANLGAMVYNTKQEMRSYHISNWLSRLRNIKRVRMRAQEQQQQQQQQQNQNHDSGGGLHSIRSSVSSISAGSTSASYSGSGGSAGSSGRMLRQTQSSAVTSRTDETDSVISTASISSTSAISPNSHSVGTTTNSNNAVFDYEALSQRLAFPDFTEFTKDS